MPKARFTPRHHAAAVACVLLISLLLHGAFGLTGTSVVEAGFGAEMPNDTAFTLPPPR